MSRKINFSTPRQTLEDMLVQSDNLSVTKEGELMIDGLLAKDLLESFGSPLYVVSEKTLRENYRRIYRTFSENWPAAVNVLYAVKSNNNMAIRAILSDEGAGGDCFGEGEFFVTMQAGTDSAKMIINGSNKQFSFIQTAIEHDIIINIDVEDEIEFIIEVARKLNKKIKVMLRLKVLNDDFESLSTDYVKTKNLLEYVKQAKWGFSLDTAEPLARRLMAQDEIEFSGYHFHIGRLTNSPEFQCMWASKLGEMIVELNQRTGFVPRIINVGGGWPQDRDPESMTLEPNPTSTETYARITCETLLEQLKNLDGACPQLWLEPGRFISGNAAVLLAKVGAIKRDTGITWVNLDTSTNHVTGIGSGGSARGIFPITGMDRQASEEVMVVGETCTDSIFSNACYMPELKRGDALVLLDAGMYPGTGQFNAIPRPAMVLVNGSDSEIIRKRETIEEVFAHHILPGRLKK